MRTLTLSLGEYEFDDTYERFSEHLIRKLFMMSLLITIIILVSLTIYNLFVAVGITDVNDLQASVFLQAGPHSPLYLDINSIIFRLC